jgi:hypothetical protein
MKNTHKQFFFELIQVLRDYQKGEFEKSDILKTYKFWIERNQFSLEELTTLTEDNFREFYSDLSGAIRSLKFELSEEMEEDRLAAPISHPASDKFLDTFTDDTLMGKKRLAELCGKSEPWIHQHKDKFKQTRGGVHLRSFLEWLKPYNIHYYRTFQKSFND